MRYALFEYTSFPICDSCKIILKSDNVKYLMDYTKGRGSKFFINDLKYKGTAYDKRSEFYGELWGPINDFVPIKYYTYIPKNKNGVKNELH